ncbi:MAG: 3-hydroxyacyl-CoA dehydrogenase NAD-binding domain-containing protein [Moritella sp.]|uniref:3-hydroxyacyl-CoA dehydrogenase NAD-binding domain-containing protein n=1 Tax=Moritella sp. TaxID=78556 RepID=UPI0029B5299E|nr:3-hydroxyacyl-CoA dehydrogenase NAD-binding domain-containing protein [Moritella sp.]MDX2321406.1 3-hydroxyacyl-CoA dehydrogenase NAD-binding domain-containing protein [Moritella sp.]
MLFNGTHFKLTCNTQNIAILDFFSPARLVSQAAVSELHQVLDQLLAVENINGLVLTTSTDNFAFGANINEFMPLFSGGADEFLAYTHAAYNKLEDLPFPTVCIVTGHCYGGGAELALTTDYRIGTPNISVGFPEVKIGILPAMGGTTRMPRLVGLDTALSWLTSGRNFKAKQALKDGFISGIVEQDHAMTAALNLINSCNKEEVNYLAERTRKKSALPLSNYELQMSLSMAKGMIFKAAGPNYPAPMTIVNIIEQSATQSRDQALSNEITGVIEKLINTGHSAAMCHVYLADLAVKSKAKKIAGTKIQECAVIGAGIMGGGIAYTNAAKGIRTPMKDINQSGLDLGLSTAVSLLEKPVKRGKITFKQAATSLNNIIPTLSSATLANADMVIEAVVENPVVKANVLKECEKSIAADAVMASNTSTISITQLASHLTRPEKFIGIHFFNPVNKMPLVEVIRGKKTNDDTVSKAVAYVNQIGKTAIVVNDCAGFFVNRILTPYMRAYSNLIAAGVNPLSIEKAMKKYGMPMGPAELIDVVGIDTSSHVLEIMSQNYAHMPLPENNIIKTLLDNDCLGQKNGAGFYLWSKDRRGRTVKTWNQDVFSLFDITATLELTEDSIINALILPMMFEAQRALDEGIISSKQEADIAMIYGTGFPAFRGGLCYAMDNIDTNQLHQTAIDLAATLADTVTYTIPDTDA